MVSNLLKNNLSVLLRNSLQRGASTSFLPSDLSNFIAWADPSFTDTITSSGGGYVSNLADKENDNDFTALGDSRPRSGVDSLNGLNVLDFANDWFVMPQEVYELPTGDYSMYILAKQDGAGASRLVSFQTNGTVAGLQYIGSEQIKFLSGNGTGVDATGVDYTEWNLFSCRRSGSTLILQVNGGANFQSAQGVNTTPTSGNIGTFLNGSFGNFQGNIGPMLFYDNALNSADSDKVEGYIMYRFGLSDSLPLDHTYRTDQTLFGGGISVIIEGFVITGQTLTAYAPTGATYQWKRAGVNISGANSSTYVVTVSDEGNSITCDIVASGKTASSNSLSNFYIGDVTSSVWLDARDSSTISTGQWSDKSGNNNHAIQGNGSLQPSYVGGADPYIQLGSSEGRYFNFTSQISGAKEVIIVLSDNNSPAYAPILGNSTSYDWHANTNNNLFSNTYADADLRVNHYQNGTSIAWSSMVKRQEKTLLYFTSSSSGNGTNINNLSQDRNIPNRAADYRIRELIILPSIQDEVTRQKIEGYEAHKWGTTADLPSDHPYKTTPA